MPTKQIRVDVKIHKKAKIAATKVDKDLGAYTEEALTEKMQGKSKSDVSEGV